VVEREEFTLSFTTFRPIDFIEVALEDFDVNPVRVSVFTEALRPHLNLLIHELRRRFQGF